MDPVRTEHWVKGDIAPPPTIVRLGDIETHDQQLQIQLL